MGCYPRAQWSRHLLTARAVSRQRSQAPTGVSCRRDVPWAAQPSVTVTDVMATGSTGRSWAPVGAVAMASTTSSPAVSLPKIV